MSRHDFLHKNFWIMAASELGIGLPRHPLAPYASTGVLSILYGRLRGDKTVGLTHDDV